MRRRHLLVPALAVLLALAGCAGPAGDLSLTPADDQRLAESASRPVPRADDPVGASQRPPVLAAIENGTVTRTGGRDVGDQALPYRYEGRYYAIESTVVGNVSGYAGGLLIDYDPGAVEGETVAYGDLPAVDRRAVAPLLAGPRRNESAGADLGVPVEYTDAEASQSVLVPDQEYAGIVYEGETYRIRGDGIRRTTLPVYRHEASLLAGNASAYAALLTERYAFRLDGLPDDQRAIVEAAINGSYEAEPDDRAFDALVDRFRAHEAVRRTDYDGNWIVLYEGRRYWASLSYGGFVTEDDPVTRPPVTPPE